MPRARRKWLVALPSPPPSSLRDSGFPPADATGQGAAGSEQVAPEVTLEQRIWNRFVRKLEAAHPDHPWTRAWLSDAPSAEPEGLPVAAEEAR